MSTGIESLTGGCLCGAIRYEVRGEPYFVTHCHCSDCRRASGAPFVTWFTIKLSDFSWLTAPPKAFASSTPVRRLFCPTCGTPIGYSHTRRADEIDITACSLDHPERLSPADHTYFTSKLPWIHLADALPRYDRTRDS